MYVMHAVLTSCFVRMDEYRDIIRILPLCMVLKDGFRRYVLKYGFGLWLSILRYFLALINVVCRVFFWR